MAKRSIPRKLTLRLDDRDKIEAALLAEYDQALEGRRHSLLLNYLREGFLASGKHGLSVSDLHEREVPPSKIEHTVSEIQPVKKQEVKPAVSSEQVIAPVESPAVKKNIPDPVAEKLAPSRQVVESPKVLNFFGQQELT